MYFQGAASQKGECPQISENKLSALVPLVSPYFEVADDRQRVSLFH